MKDLFKIILILSFFAFIGLATSKEVLQPCELQIQKYLREDAEVFGYYSGSMNDTAVVTIDTDSARDSLWASQTDQICKILRDSCQLNGRKVLVARWMDDPAQRQTRYGKTIYFRTCP